MNEILAWITVSGILCAILGFVTRKSPVLSIMAVLGAMMCALTMIIILVFLM